MATISNVKLDITKGKGSSKVTVNYTVCFTKCEMMDNTTFVEKVTLMGDDAFSDDRLTVLYFSCVQATERCINRKFSRTVKNSTLNEDNSWFNRTDEVYALIEMKPFKASSARAKSNIEYDRF